MIMDAHRLYKEGHVDAALIKYTFLADLGYEVAQSNVAYILDRGFLLTSSLLNVFHIMFPKQSCFFWVSMCLSLFCIFFFLTLLFSLTLILLFTKMAWPHMQEAPVELLFCMIADYWGPLHPNVHALS